jgi:hypothetical protein
MHSPRRTPITRIEGGLEVTHIAPDQLRALYDRR